ncbi:MAG: hypothetical protein KatS3mg129_2818 [Leptospiraceae bacterium]|nr:MAG: hypothetical protein KatS3mg129_2818 [Leptospiraceae bacterium]
MLKASFVIGLIGGILGIITGFLGGCAGICVSTLSLFSYSSNKHSSGIDAGLDIGTGLIFLSILGIIGSALVQKEKIIGSILQALYPVIGFIYIIVIGKENIVGNIFSVAFGLYSFLFPALLFAVAAILGFLGKPEENKK